MTEQRKTVRVSCAFPNGIELRVFKPGGMRDLETGDKTPVQDGPAVTLKGPSALHAGATDPSAGAPVVTEGVDAEFMNLWLEQNKGTPLAGMIKILEDDGDRA